MWYIVLPLAAAFFLIPCYGLWRFGVHYYKSSGFMMVFDKYIEILYNNTSIFISSPESFRGVYIE